MMTTRGTMGTMGTSRGTGIAGVIGADGIVGARNAGTETIKTGVVRTFRDIGFPRRNDDGWRCFGVTTLIDKYEELFRGDIPSDICVCEYCKTAIPWGGSDTQRGSIWSCEVCGNDFCEVCFKDKHGSNVAHEMFSTEGDVDNILCPPCFTKHQEADRANTSTLAEFQNVGGDA